MGGCGSKGVAVGKERDATADSAASLTGRSPSAESSVSPSTGSQLRAAAKTAWQTSARNLRKSLSRMRQESYGMHNSNIKDSSREADAEEIDSAGRGGRPGGRSRPRPLSSVARAAGGSIAWRSSSSELEQSGGQRGRYLSDTAKVKGASRVGKGGDGADAGDSCVRSFHVRDQATDSMDDADECEEQTHKESRQISGNDSQQRRKVAGISCGSGSGTFSPFAATSPGSDGVDPDGWAVGVPSTMPRNSSPAEAGTLLTTAASCSPAIGNPPAGRGPNSDGARAAPPPPPPMTSCPAAVPVAVAAQVAQPVAAVEAAAATAALPGPDVDGGAQAAAGGLAVPPDGAASASAATAAATDAVQWVIRPGPPVESSYVLGDVLGKGSFGVVRAATHLASGAKVAVKTIRKSLLAAADVSALRREVEILHHLSGHPHISQLLGVYEEASQLHLVLELYQGGDLFDAIIAVGRHSERAAADVMRTVLTAISYCHAMGVAHRDIKPENFMLTAPLHPPAAGDGGSSGGGGQQPCPHAAAGGGGRGGGEETLGSRLKLIDFGLSVFCSDTQPLTDTVGTSYYVAPEVLARSYTRSADVWSAGVILHILLTGYAPFDGRNDQEILRAVQTGKLDLVTDPIWTSISRDATAVLAAMLNRDPVQRATADQVLAMPWLGCTASACTASAAPLPGVVSERMRRFARMNSFKKEARRVVASLLKPEEVAGLVAQFKALDANGDGKLNMQELRDGLARQELQSRQGLATGDGGAGAGAPRGPLKEEELQELMDRSDLNGDGLLDQSEFLGAALPTAVIARQAQQALAAANLVRPGSRGSPGNAAGGAMTAMTMAGSAAAAATTVYTNPLATAFAHFDADGSGFITPDELRSALAAHHPESQGPDIRALLSRIDRDADGRISYPEFVDMLVQEVDEDDEVYGCGGARADPKGHGSGTASPSQDFRKLVGGQHVVGAYALDAASAAQLQQQQRGTGRSRGRAAAAAAGAAAAAATAAKRRLRVPAAWGVAAQPAAVSVPPPPPRRPRNGQNPSNSFMSNAAVQSGSGGLSSFDWCDECSSHVETSPGEGANEGSSVHNVAGATAAVAGASYGSKGQSGGRGGGGGGYVPSRLSPSLQPPGTAHAGLYRAAEAAALTLMGGGPDGESSLLGQMSVGSSVANIGGATAVTTAASAAASGGSGYNASRPPAIAIPMQPVASRRARRHSAAETMGDGYGYGYGHGDARGGAGAADGGVADRRFGVVVAERVAARGPRMSEGHGFNIQPNSSNHNSRNNHVQTVNGPRQHAALHPGSTNATRGGVGTSALGGGHRTRGNRQVLYDTEDYAARPSSVSPLKRGGAHCRGESTNTSAVQYACGDGGGVSAPSDHLVSPAAAAAAVAAANACGGGGFRQRGPALQTPPRALSPMTAVSQPPVELYPSPSGGWPGKYNPCLANMEYSDQPLAALRIRGGGAAAAAALAEEAAAVLPPGACGEECFTGAPTMSEHAAASAAAAVATCRHRRSLASGLDDSQRNQLHQQPYHHQQQQQQQPGAPLGIQVTARYGGHRNGGGGGGGGGVYSEPLPRLASPGGGVRGSGNSPGWGDGMVRTIMPYWEEEEDEEEPN